MIADLAIASVAPETSPLSPHLLSLEFAHISDVPLHDDSWLSVRERAVHDRLRFPKRRSDWRLGRWTAKLAAAQLGLDGEIEILAAADGAPELYLDGARTAHNISISHSHGLAMAAVSRVPLRLGCDVEYIEPRSSAFAKSYFTAPEAQLVCDAFESEQPLLANLIWSAKESVLKAARVGLRYDTRRVEVAFARGSGWQPFWAQLDASRWQGRWRAQHGWVHTIAFCPL